jgi:hypothetical protein
MDKGRWRRLPFSFFTVSGQRATLLAFDGAIIHRSSADFCDAPQRAHKACANQGRHGPDVERRRVAVHRHKSFSRINRPELFFGLVGAIGTDLEAATNALEGALSRVGYRVILVKLSELPQKYERFVSGYVDAETLIVREFGSEAATADFKMPTPTSKGHS